MPEINFVDNPGAGGQNPKPDGQPPVEWTKPEQEPGKSPGSLRVEKDVLKPMENQQRVKSNIKLDNPDRLPRPEMQKGSLSSIFKKNNYQKGGFKQQKEEIAAAGTEKSREKASKRPALNFPGESQEDRNIKKLIHKKISESNIKIGEGIEATNLIAGEDTIIIDWNKNMLFLALAVFAGIFVIVVLYGFEYFNEQKASLAGQELSQEILALRQQKDKAISNAKTVDALWSKVQKVRALVGRHVYWTNFFKFLEDNTLAEVYYSSGLSGTADGTYSFSVAGPNFATVSKQIKVFKNSEFVEEVSVGEASLEEDIDPEKIYQKRVVFDLQLKVKPDIFLKNQPKQNVGGQ